MKVILQTQGAECGLACLAMVLSAHGSSVELADLRQRFSISLKGANLEQLIRYAAAVDLTARAIRVDLDELAQVKTPCILHWNFNHFVVLEKVRHGQCTILDPAFGRRVVSKALFSENFTGVALELTPSGQYSVSKGKEDVPISRFTGTFLGLRPALAKIILLTVCLQGLQIAAPMFNQLLVDEAIMRHDADLATIMLVGFMLLLITQTALGMLRGWMSIILSQDISLQWRGNVFSHLVRLPLSFFESRHLGDVLSKFSALQAFQKFLTGSTIDAFLNLLMAGISGVVIFLYSAKLALVVVCSTTLYMLLRAAYYTPFKEASSERIVLGAKENTHFIESIRSIQALKLFGKQESRRANWQNILVEIQNRDTKTAKLAQIFSASRVFIFGAQNLLILWFASKMIMGDGGSPTLTIGMLFAFLSYKGQFSDSISALVDFGIEYKMLSIYKERLGDIVLAAPEERSSFIGMTDEEVRKLSPTIELDDVSFRYGEGEEWVLKNVSLRVDIHDSIAIVGASGNGKTTLLKIIVGLLEPTTGRVLYGGISIKSIGLDQYRNLFGVVMQDDTLLSGSIADNICFKDYHHNSEKIEEAAKNANIRDEIIKMPMGFRSLVGDLGTGLSGGQRQRILLARAIYKEPMILALDEATSHLDVGSEQRIVTALNGLNLGRIVVAHRADTIYAAKKVFEVRNSNLKETDKQSYFSNRAMLAQIEAGVV